MSTEKVTYLLELRDKFSKNLNAANKGVSNLDKNANTAGLSLGKLKGALAALGIGAVAKSIVTAGMNMEQTRVAFATFLGDAEKGNKVINDLNQFSNITPFDNDEVVKSGRILLAARIPAEKLTATLKNIGDVASGTQVPLNEMASIYGKIQNKGKAQAEELNQLAERGIPILDILGKKFNTTAAGVLEMGSKGKITSDVIAEAFASMAGEGGMFFNMMEKQSATAAGKLSTLQGSLGLLAAELGEEANPAIGEIIDKLIQFTNYLKDNKEQVIAVVKWVARGAAAFAAYKATVFATQKAMLIYNAVQKATAITSALFTGGLKKARVAMQALNVTMKANPLGLIIAGLTIAIPLLVSLFEKTKKTSAVVEGLTKVNERANKAFADESVKLRVLKVQLDSGNISQEKRKKIINQINKEYGTYLPKLLTEKSTNKEIAAAIEEVNKQLIRKARIQAAKDILAENAKKEIELTQTILSETKLREKALDSWVDKAAAAGAYISGGREKYVKARVKEEKKAAMEELANLNKQSKAIAKLIGQSEVLNETKKDAGGETDKPGGLNLNKDAQKTLETGIKAGAPKVINVNIDKLVETFNIETKQYKEAPIRVREEMTKAFMDAINDAVLMQE